MQLTEGQVRFARQHDADSPLPSEHGMVLLYAHEPGMTIRWLVDRMGQPVARWVFRRDDTSL